MLNVKNNFIGLTALLLVVIVAVFLYLNNSKTKQELSSLKAELNQKYNEVYDNLDSKIDKWDAKISKLKEEGYVEDEDFTDMALEIVSASVLIVSSKDNVRWSDTDKAFILNEDVFKIGGGGTGFFINKKGDIVTAKHVVDTIGEDNLIVGTFSGRLLRADLIKSSDRSDIAILRTNRNADNFVEFGYFDNFDIGEEIGFVGSFFNKGLVRPLVHRGVVSGKYSDNTGMFTINAFVNKGNSGGPVFSVKSGRVLGVLRAREKDSSSEQYISLPEGYSSGLNLGGIDPLKFNVDLYNKTLEVVSDVSQVGVGIASSIDNVRVLLSN